MSSLDAVGDDPPIKATESDDDNDRKPSPSAKAGGSEKADAATEENRKEDSKPQSEDATEQPPGGSSNLEIIPSSSRTPQDVLCGRGMPFQSYPGNVTMHELVSDHRDEYMSSKRSQKPLVIKAIIQKLRDSGSRFLKPYGEFRSNEDDQWVEVDDQYVYDKIAHVIRHRQRAARGGTPSSAAKQETAREESETNASAGVAALPSDAVASASARAPSNQDLLAGAAAAGFGPFQGLVATGAFGGPLAQQQSQQSALASIVSAQNQEAVLRALLSSGQTPLLSGMGLLGQPPALPLLGQNLLGMQQQQLSSSWGQQQPSWNQTILAQLQQQQLLRGIALQQPTQPSSLLNDLVNEELRRRALQSLVQGQGQDQDKPSDEGEEKK